MASKQYTYTGTEPLDVVDVHGSSIRIDPGDKVTPAQYGQEWLDDRPDFKPVVHHRSTKGGDKQ